PGPRVRRGCGAPSAAAVPPARPPGPVGLEGGMGEVHLEPRNLSSCFDAAALVCVTPAGSKSRRAPPGRADGSALPSRGCGRLWERLERESPGGGPRGASDTPPARACQAEAPFETEAKAPQGRARPRLEEGPGTPAAKDVRRRPAAAQGAAVALRAQAPLLPTRWRPWPRPAGPRRPAGPLAAQQRPRWPTRGRWAPSGRPRRRKAPQRPPPSACGGQRLRTPRARARQRQPPRPSPSEAPPPRRARRRRARVPGAPATTPRASRPGSAEVRGTRPRRPRAPEGGGCRCSAGEGGAGALRGGCARGPSPPRTPFSPKPR
ncbi:unnamed protein product, partial [Prorocentrum cordatum]